jgi:hypothetical protein
VFVPLNAALLCLNILPGRDNWPLLVNHKKSTPKGGWVKKSVCAVLVFIMLAEVLAFAGLGSGNALYVGGTISSMKENSEGKIITSGETNLVFDSKNGKISIPYEQVNSLEYGQKAGRRLGLAIAVSPLFLFSKKRRHFLTIGFKDVNDKQQAAVLELGKSIITPTITTLEARTGKKIDYEDDEARKSATGGKK